MASKKISSDGYFSTYLLLIFLVSFANFLVIFSAEFNYLLKHKI